MRNVIFFAICAGCFIGLTVFAQNTSPTRATVGQPAPDFTLTGGDGKTHSLSDYKGKFIVLEWTNPNCPFVHKFYDSGTMQNLQKEETAKGVVWLRINSGAPGHDGYQTVADVVSYEQANHVASTETLLDPDGTAGHLFGSRNTPTMFVIDPKGTLIYAGGIDDKPSPDPADIATAKNYVTAALDEAMAGKPVSVPVSRPYGCSVKYATN
ncbi:MAG: redoxin domain-containing protein [Methylacidiphilales bacterium]|nr:redoxin domain-containing protein [Candidatus Methylacidiphilales bacterium]